MLMTSRSGWGKLSPEQEDQLIAAFKDASGNDSEIADARNFLRESGIPDHYARYLEAEGRQQAARETPIGRRIRAVGEGVQRGMQFGQEIIPTDIAEPEEHGGFRFAGDIIGTGIGAATLPGRLLAGGTAAAAGSIMPGRALLSGGLAAGRAIAGSGKAGIAAGGALATAAVEGAGYAGRQARGVITGESPEEREDALQNAAINALFSAGLDTVIPALRGLSKEQKGHAISRIVDRISKAGGGMADRFWKSFSKSTGIQRPMAKAAQETAEGVPALLGAGPQPPKQLPQQAGPSVQQTGPIREVTPPMQQPGTSAPPQPSPRVQEAQSRAAGTYQGPSGGPIEMPQQAGAQPPPPPKPTRLRGEDLGTERAAQALGASPSVVRGREQMLSNFQKGDSVTLSDGRTIIIDGLTPANRMRGRELTTGRRVELDPNTLAQPFSVIGPGQQSGFGPDAPAGPLSSLLGQ